MLEILASENAKYLKKDPFSAPPQLLARDHATPFTDRERAITALCKQFSHKAELHDIESGCKKERSPIVALYGGPGSGKSRCLDEFAALGRDASPSVIVDGLMAEHKDIFQSAVRVSVTFNSAMPLNAAKPCDQDAQSALATRIFYALFINSEAMLFDRLQARVNTPVLLVSFLKYIHDRLDQESSDVSPDRVGNRNPKRAVIICVDEMMLAVRVKDPVPVHPLRWISPMRF